MGPKDVLQYLLLFILLTNVEFSSGEEYNLYDLDKEFRWKSCPSEESIAGCTCMTKPNGDKRLDCGKSYTVEEYVSGMKKMEFSKNAMLDVIFFHFRSSPNDIPSKMFEGLNIKLLDFDKCSITKWADEIGGPAFVGLEDTLETLKIEKSIIRTSNDPEKFEKEHNEFTLSHLRKLKEIDMHNNTLWNFCTEYFGDGLDSLEYVELESNKIMHICDGAFANLERLKSIQLGYNEIREVSRSMFPNPALYLEKINLRFNKIQALPEDFFTNMPLLNSVNLNGNVELSTIPERTWRPVWSQLRFLEFRVLNLDCSDEMIGWMFKVRKPFHISGKCYSPRRREDKLLRDVIDENQK